MGDMIKQIMMGAMFVKLDEVGIGVVVRDANEEVLAALSEKISYPCSVEVLEVLIARRATQFTV